MNEPYIYGMCEQISVLGAGYELFAVALQRTDGGFDLVLDREASDFEGIETDMVTKLRHLAREDGLVLIAQFSSTKFTKELRADVEATFLRWLEANLCFSPQKSVTLAWDQVEFGY